MVSTFFSPRSMNLLMSTAGVSEEKRVDAQAGAEAALQVMLSALRGALLVPDISFLDCADIGSLSYLVQVDEIIGMAARIMRGIQVDSGIIMLDLIEKVGPGGSLSTRRNPHRCAGGKPGCRPCWIGIRIISGRAREASPAKNWLQPR